LTSARTPGAATSAYRLLRAIFNTAVTDELVAHNPCRIRGAGADRSKERQIPTVAQVEALMQAMPAKLRAAVVLAAWGTLRRGEVLGLRRNDIDLAAGTVRVEKSLGERRNGDVIVGPPKSGAGVRTVHMPLSAMEVLEEHLRSFVGREVDAPLFIGRTGLALRPQGLEEAWRSAKEVGLPALRFHDLRHFAGTMAAAAGASTKEVMARRGWSSPQMALRYEHATKERDRFIAHALEALSQSSPEASDTPIVTADDQGDRARSRTQRARRPSDEEDALSETGSDQDFSAARVRPSGFEPETCGEIPE
jgi:integrase